MEAYCYACCRPVEGGAIVFQGQVFCSFRCVWTVRTVGSVRPGSGIPAGGVAERALVGGGDGERPAQWQGYV